ncbi:MAG: hypothetical protein ACREFO_13935 [Acetobacteraceae bacterium]
MPAMLGVVAAARPARAQETNPFATHKLVLQLSDASIEKQKLIVSVSNSVLRTWPETTSIDVVAFGPGVVLLYADSPERVAVDSLVSEGVRFEICMNTIDTIIRRTGRAPALNPLANKVAYGVPRIMQLVSEGYILVRP